MSAKEKANHNQILSDNIMALLYNDDNQKTLKSILKEKKDSALGAYSKMMMSIENVLSQYADEWASKQHR